MELLSYIWTYIVQAFGLFIAFVFAGIFIYLVLRRLHSRKIALALLVVFLAASIAFYVPNGLPRGFEYPFFLTTYGPGQGPVLPLGNVVAFIQNFSKFERVENIARDPNDVPPPIERDEPAIVDVSLTAKEVIAEMAPGVLMNY